MSKLKRLALSEPYICGNAWKYVKACLDSGWVSSAGPLIGEFERSICAYTGAGHAVACVNGTAALHLALLAAGVGPGDEVIVPTLTFIAPVNAVRYAGAEPVFMDCDDFLGMDPEKLESFCRHECVLTRAGLKNRRSRRFVRAVIPVHVFGIVCDMQPIMRTARRFGLRVIEDATESLGSVYCGPRELQAGTIGDSGVYSFNGNKIITCGAGGMLVTASQATAQKARYLSTQARDDVDSYRHDAVGYNYRLSSLQAALGLAQLEKLPAFIKAKTRAYAAYEKGLPAIAGLRLLRPPRHCRSNHWLCAVNVDAQAFGCDAQALKTALGKIGIETRMVWLLNHWQKPYAANQSYRIEKAPLYWKNMINIPSGPQLTGRDTSRVLAGLRAVRGYYGHP